MVNRQTDAEARVVHLQMKLARIKAGERLSKVNRLSYEETCRVEKEARKADREIQEAELSCKYGFRVMVI